MSRWSFSHLTDHELFPALAAGVADERGALSRVLALMAEFDARRLYLPAAHPTMYDYCVRALRMSEDRACKRIRAARLVRRFPGILDRIADGRLGLSGLLLLAPRLTPELADELLDAAVDRTRSQLEEWLAARFPRPDVPTSLVAGPGGCATAPTPACPPHDSSPAQVVGNPSAPGRMNGAAGETAEASEPSARIAPLSAGRYELRGTLSQDMHARLMRAREMLSHSLPSGDPMEVLDRALTVLLSHLEKRRYGSSEQSRRPRMSTRARHIPTEVRRRVSERDGNRCTFTNASGERCHETRFLEFDHVRPLALGGATEPGNLRLLCRAHNRYEAERVLGREHVAARRELERRRRAHDRAARRAASARAASRATAAARGPAGQALHDDVRAALRALGFAKDEADRGAALVDTLPGVPLEDCLRRALAELTAPLLRRGERLERRSA